MTCLSLVCHLSPGPKCTPVRLCGDHLGMSLVNTNGYFYSTHALLYTTVSACLGVLKVAVAAVDEAAVSDGVVESSAEVAAGAVLAQVAAGVARRAAGAV